MHYKNDYVYADFEHGNYNNSETITFKMFISIQIFLFILI